MEMKPASVSWAPFGGRGFQVPGRRPCRVEASIQPHISGLGRGMENFGEHTGEDVGKDDP
jgi:hypothetical protein